MNDAEIEQKKRLVSKFIPVYRADSKLGMNRYNINSSTVVRRSGINLLGVEDVLLEERTSSFFVGSNDEFVSVGFAVGS